MPRIIVYEHVLARMTARGMTSLYYNSGAFGFDDSSVVHAAGWIGPPDASIRGEAIALARAVPPPYERNLSNLFERAWTNHLPDVLWIMPASHWAYELDVGNVDWLPEALREVGIDSADLQHRTNAAAIAFDLIERAIARHFIERVLEHLAGSDFSLAFPDHPAICTLHHHKQLWWQTTDAVLAGKLRALPDTIDRD